MDQQLVADNLTSDSDEIADLKANLNVLDGFIGLIDQLEALPDTSRRFYEESRSLYQTTAVGCDITFLENLLSKFFGEPLKPAGKVLPRKLRKSSVVNFLGGAQKDQSLFTIDLKTGQFYGALWPWRRNKKKIEIHLGYCSDWMTDEDYQSVERLVKQSISRDTLEQVNAGTGGQIHGKSLPSFLQMAEMEKSSFTLRITSRNRVGELHLADGNLINADLDGNTGYEAAFTIISWDNVSIGIEPLNASKEREINMPLMHVLMVSLKQKDEAPASKGGKPPAQPKGRPKAKPGDGRPSKRLVRLERAPEPTVPGKKTPLLMLLGIGVGIFAVLAAVTVVTFHIMDNRRSSDGFSELLKKVEETDILEQRIDHLNAYLEKFPNTGYRKNIEVQIEKINQAIEDRDFDQATLEVSGLPVDDQYEAKAIKIYSGFLEKYPDSRHTDQINQSVSEIRNLLDQYYYEELKRAARLDFNKRLETYRTYLSRFPDGKFRDDVLILIREMGEKYLVFLQDEAKTCESTRRWETCIEHADNFVSAYAGMALSDKATAMKTEMEDRRDLFELRKSAEETGTDYQKTYRLYQNYLKENPETTQRQNIEKEIARLSGKLKEQRQWQAVERYAKDPNKELYARIQKLDQYIRNHTNGAYAGDAQSLMEKLEADRLVSLRRQQIKARKRSDQERIERQAAEQARRRERIKMAGQRTAVKLSGSSRYRANAEGTFTDSTTGLTWALLDSYQELEGCITYEDALKYVQNLSVGGRRSWRLPTAYELAAIYKKPPYFPASGANWYWSVETSVKGYHTVVDVVTASQEPVFQREQRPMTDCGTARAVLVPQP